MELKILEINNQKIAEVIAEEIVVNNTQDALDIMTDANYYGARSIILEEKHLNSDFFDLRTGMAGEILQKYSNYRVKLAIVGDFEKFKSKSLNAFIFECNRGNAIFFAPDKETAISKIA